MSLLIVLIVVGLLLFPLLLGYLVYAGSRVPRVRSAWSLCIRMVTAGSLATKLKIIISFYQIITKVERIYDVTMPSEVRQLLGVIDVIISFNLDAVLGPALECFGFGTHIDRLRFWVVAPAAVSTSVFAATLAYAYYFRDEIQLEYLDEAASLQPPMRKHSAAPGLAWREGALERSDAGGGVIGSATARQKMAICPNLQLSAAPAIPSCHTQSTSDDCVGVGEVTGQPTGDFAQERGSAPLNPTLSSPPPSPPGASATKSRASPRRQPAQPPSFGISHRQPLPPLVLSSALNDQSQSSHRSQRLPRTNKQLSHANIEDDTASSLDGSSIESEFSNLRSARFFANWRRLSPKLVEQGAQGSVALWSVPIILRVLFLSYPVVTAVAFEGFLFHDMNSDGRWMIADVSVNALSIDYDRIFKLSVIAILLYPVGTLLLSGALLLAIRGAVTAGKSNPLLTATAFLHDEFTVEFYWWEVLEMIRRLVLVGFAVFVMPGSVQCVRGAEHLGMQGGE